MSTRAQPGRPRRLGRGLKIEEKSANSQISKSPHTQKSGQPRVTSLDFVQVFGHLIRAFAQLMIPGGFVFLTQIQPCANVAA